MQGATEGVRDAPGSLRPGAMSPQTEEHVSTHEIRVNRWSETQEPAPDTSRDRMPAKDFAPGVYSRRAVECRNDGPALPRDHAGSLRQRKPRERSPNFGFQCPDVRG